MKTKTNKKSAKKVAKKDNGECTNPNMKAGREMNPLTGCRVGSKGDIIGSAMLKNLENPVAVLASVKEAVVQTWTNKKPTDSEIQRKAMSWIDWLHELHASEFKNVATAIECSKATRLANKPAKAEKGEAEPKVKKAPAKKVAAKKVVAKKPAKKAAVKKEEKVAPAEQAAPAPEATL